MLSQTVRQVAGTNNFPFHLAIAGGVGLLLGAASLKFSPMSILGALAAGGLTLAVLKRPEIALLGYLVLTSSIISDEQNPAVPIGIGTLYGTDLILLGLFGLIALRWLVEPDFDVVRTPLDLPMVSFVGVALLSTLIGILRSSVSLNQSLGEVRKVMSYLTFFAVTNLVREDRQLNLLLRGLWLLATVVAVVMVAQYLVGPSVRFLPGRLETLSVEGTSYRGVARMRPPGESLIMAMFIVTTATLIQRKLTLIGILKPLQWGLLGLGLVLTFFRSYWVSIGFALLLLVYLVGEQARQRLVILGLVLMLLTAAILLPLVSKPESRVSRLLVGFTGRLTSLANRETFLDSESTLRWRDLEYEYALPQIASHPFIGLGLGARYRSWLQVYDWEQHDNRDFIHNGHLWILMKSGMLGYFGFAWLSVAFVIRGFRNWRDVSVPELRACVLGFTLAYVGTLIIAVVEPTVMYWSWTPVIGVMMGINEVILRKLTVTDSDQIEGDETNSPTEV